MSPKAFSRLFFITLAAVAAAVCLWATAPSYAPDKAFGEKLSPGLLEKINDVAVMSIEHEGDAVTFVKDSAGNWSLMESAGYPADKERLRNALIGLAGLEKIEPKTALPEYYADIGVEDSGVNAKSYLVTLLDADGGQLLNLLIGKSTSGIRWNGQGYFVRKPDEAQSWLVRGAADVTGGMLSWVKTGLFDFYESEISRIAFVDETKKREAVFRRATEFSKMEPVWASDGFFMKSDAYIDTMLKTIAGMDFSAVEKRPDDLAQRTPFLSAVVETNDGLTAYLFFYLEKDVPYLAVTFNAEETAPEDVKAHAAELENRHKAWLYKIHGAKLAAILPFLPIAAQ